MTHMPARIGLEPDVRDVLLEQVQDENAALHAENGRLRAENERLRSEGSAKDAEIERRRVEIAALQARLGRPNKNPRNSSMPPSQAVKPNASGQPAVTPAHPRRGHAGAHRPLCDNPTEVKDMRAGGGAAPNCAARPAAGGRGRAHIVPRTCPGWRKVRARHTTTSRSRWHRRSSPASSCGAGPARAAARRSRPNRRWGWNRDPPLAKTFGRRWCIYDSATPCRMNGWPRFWMYSSG